MGERPIPMNSRDGDIHYLMHCHEIGNIWNMFVWMSGFQNSLIHIDCNMFEDEYTSVNKIPKFEITNH